MLSISNLMAATVKVSITSIQASSVGNVGANHAQLSFPCTDTPSTQAGHPCQDQAVAEDHHTSPAPHQKELLCASALDSEMPSQSKGSTWLDPGGARSTLQGYSHPWLWTHGSNEDGMKQHPCMEPQSKLSPCASSPYFITEASYIWRFRSLGKTQSPLWVELAHREP